MGNGWAFISTGLYLATLFSMLLVPGVRTVSPEEKKEGYDGKDLQKKKVSNKVHNE